MIEQQISKIKDKLGQLQRLDEKEKVDKKSQQKVENKPAHLPFKTSLYLTSTLKEPSINDQLDPVKQNKLAIDTQGDIVKQIAKLKPYLTIKKPTKTMQEIEEQENKQCSKQNYKMMCELAIHQNWRLCEIISEQMNPQEGSPITNPKAAKRKKEGEGWIFEIFFKIGTTQQEFKRKPFKSGYAVMTEIVEIFPSLTFSSIAARIIPSEITHVKYLQENNFEIIRVEQNQEITMIGFLNSAKFDLFDRMLFLQKNMSRSTSSRLFQNQLIRNIYEGK